MEWNEELVVSCRAELAAILCRWSMIACTWETGRQWRRCQVWKSFPSILAPAESNQRICGNRPPFQAWYLSRVHSLRLCYTHSTLQLCVRTNDVRTVHMYAGDARHRRRRVLAVLICACSTAPCLQVTGTELVCVVGSSGSPTHKENE
jgi:hypothetical protein